MQHKIDFEKLQFDITNLFQDFTIPLLDYGIYFAFVTNNNENQTIDWHVRNKNKFIENNNYPKLNLDQFFNCFYNIIIEMGLNLNAVGITIFLSENAFKNLFKDNINSLKNEGLMIKEFTKNEITWYIQFAIFKSFLPQ